MFKKLCKLAYTHRKALAAVFALYCAMLILVILFGAYFSPSACANESPGAELGDGWRVVEDGRETASKAALPYSVKDKKCKVVELYRTLPETGFPSGMLAVTAHQNELDVLLGGTSLYSYHPGDEGGKTFTPGSGRFFVALPEGFAGKEICLRYTRTVPGDDSPIGGISLQSHLQNSFFFPPGSELLFILMFSLFTVGAALTVVAVLSGGPRFLGAPIFLLALFAISCSVWVCCSTGLAQFFTQNLILLHSMEYIALYAMPITLCMFAWLTWRCCPETTLPCIAVTSVFFAAALTLKALDVLDFYSLLPVFHLLVLFGCAAFAAALRPGLRSHEVSLRMFFVGLLLFFACCAGEIIRVCFFPSDLLINFFVLGILCLMCFTLASCLYGLKRRLRTQTESRIYKRLAYTDKLTGLRNRLTFEEDMEKLERSQDKYRSIIIASLDINRFKSVNDTYGHAAGDEVLRVVANGLTAICNGKNRRCYRLGGDEFCLIATDETVRGINSLLDRMNNTLEGGFAQFPVSVAFGTTEYNKFLHSTLMDVLKASDNLMYRSKQGLRRRVSDRVQQP